MCALCVFKVGVPEKLNTREAKRNAHYEATTVSVCGRLLEKNDFFPLNQNYLG